MIHTGQQNNEVKRVYWKKGKCTRFKGFKIFQSGLATTYGKNRREIEDTYGQWGMKVVSDHFYRREHSFLVCQFAFAFFQQKKR